MYYLLSVRATGVVREYGMIVLQSSSEEWGRVDKSVLEGIANRDREW
jgi:hypothetical protein